MKLKEKLAEEYSDNYADQRVFLAGFEKAREMARLEAENYPTQEDDEPCSPYGFCNTCGGGPAVAKFIEKIGEEEVD